ncbi:hypothetical protein [Bdellovibrio sp. HCB337]|uniref:hypothetical protein n=1 Tax=Bdellovibrio sp. HCB337 TaxID=3394358 RepID=UPI0039A74A68
MKKSFVLAVILFVAACASSEKQADTAQSVEVKTDTVAQTTPATPVAEEKAKEETQKVATPAKNSEWKGDCRKVVNEGGKEVKNSPYKRLQSSYAFDGTKVTWFVKSFADTKCQSLFGGNSSTFKCDANPLKKAATCKQVSVASWENNAWKDGKMVDHAGYPNELTIVYQVLPKKGNKVSLNSTSTESGELQTETLTKPE